MPGTAPPVLGGGVVAQPPTLEETIAALAEAVKGLGAVVDALRAAGAFTTVGGGGGSVPQTTSSTAGPPTKSEPPPAKAPAPPPPLPPGVAKEKLIVPVDDAKVTSRYGAVSKVRNHVPHTGTDYAAPTGTKVKAAAGGTVVDVGTEKVSGKFIVVEHGDGYSTYYGHLSAQDVKKGDAVKQGDAIGKVGSTGLSTGPHLHFQLMKGTKRTDQHEDVEKFMKGGGTV
ncbi:MAG: LysM/M23/M37 peptidase [Thermoleophilia bacterium]|jgi:murein DD-endopeptidase MepM/ murein hydrolase activator NlpD|nr:LysM/M23/M37 peptidase [Thermoleophilia bacterium]